MNIRAIARCALVVIPIFFVLGFYRGCSKGHDEAFLKTAIKTSSLATIKADSITLHLWHVPSPVETWSVSYSIMGDPKSAITYALPKPFVTPTISESFELAFTAAYSEIIEDPTTKKRRLIINPLPAFLAACSGHTTGFYSGMTLGWGDDNATMSRLAKDQAFREEILDGFYDHIATRSIRFLEQHPMFPGAVEDKLLFTTFSRNATHNEKERAQIHFTILKYLNEPRFKNMPHKAGDSPIEFIKIIAILSGLTWIGSVIFFLRK